MDASIQQVSKYHIIAGILCSALVGISFFLGYQILHAASCHFITQSSQTPSGYASPVSFFGGSLLIKGDCNAGSIAVTVGNGEPTTYIYDKSYLWTGSQWQAKTLSGSNKQGVWIPKQATTNFTSSQSPTYYVAYTCEWVNQAWKCGCQNQSCTQNQWQLQTFQTTSGSQGGSGSTASLCPAGNGSTQHVTPATLANALANASAGSVITLGSGTYGGTYTLSKNGSSNNPIHIKAASGASPTISGTIVLKGNYARLEGLTFNRGEVISEGDHNRITRNRFRTIDSAAITVRNGASNNRIDHNDLSDLVQGTGESYGIQIDLTGTSAITKDTLIDHNYIHDFTGWKDNGHEGIQVINSLAESPQDTGIKIIRNLLDRVEVDTEAVSLKTSGITVEQNTLLNSEAMLSNRHGESNRWIDNYVENSQGIFILGDMNEVSGNVVKNGDVMISAGDTTYQEFVDKRQEGKFPAAYETEVINNSVTGAIRVGHNPSWVGGSVAARNTVLRNNSGTIELLKQSGTDNRGGSYQGSEAEKLSESQVGLGAHDPYCQ